MYVPIMNMKHANVIMDMYFMEKNIKVNTMLMVIIFVIDISQIND